MTYTIQVYSPNLQSGYFTSLVEAEGPYQAVEKVVGNWPSFPVVLNEIFATTKLSEIVPIHNVSGIRSRDQIFLMEKELSLGKEIFHENGLPNCKLVLLADNKLLLFDGHHTMLAYVRSGKKLLKDIPHLIVSRQQLKPVSPEDIAHFFPKEAKKLILENCLNYVVNWQADPGKQVEERRVKSIGELAAALRD